MSMVTGLVNTERGRLIESAWRTQQPFKFSEKSTNQYRVSHYETYEIADGTHSEANIEIVWDMAKDDKS